MNLGLDAAASFPLVREYLLLGLRFDKVAGRATDFESSQRSQSNMFLDLHACQIIRTALKARFRTRFEGRIQPFNPLQ